MTLAQQSGQINRWHTLSHQPLPSLCCSDAKWFRMDLQRRARNRGALIRGERSTAHDQMDCGRIDVELFRDDLRQCGP